MEKSFLEYTIVWKIFNVNSPIGKHLKVTNDIGLPYFLDGRDKINFESKKTTHLSNLHLLMGLLVSYDDNPPTIDISFSKKYYLPILKDLTVFFQAESVENLILDISCFIREKNGEFPSFLALKAGIDLKPKSSKIKFDCCIDLFNMLEVNKFPDELLGKELLSNLVSAIDPEDINPDFKGALKEIKQWVEENI